MWPLLCRWLIEILWKHPRWLWSFTNFPCMVWCPRWLLVSVSLVIILWLLSPTELSHSFKARAGFWRTSVAAVGFLHMPGVNSLWTFFVHWSTWGTFSTSLCSKCPFTYVQVPGLLGRGPSPDWGHFCKDTISKTILKLPKLVTFTGAKCPLFSSNFRVRWSVE